MEKFPWAEIDVADGAKQPVTKQKSSFVFVDLKGSPRRKRKSFRITRRKVSIKLQGIPKNFSLADLPSQTTYGGIPKNSSVVHLHNHSSHGGTGYCSERTSPMQRHQGRPGSYMGGSSSSSPASSVFINPTSDSGKKSDGKTPDEKIRYQHSLSQNAAGDYPSINKDDNDPKNRITQLPDDLYLVEKRVQIDQTDGSAKAHPHHARHVTHTPSDLFIAGDDNCFIIGGG